MTKLGARRRQQRRRHAPAARSDQAGAGRQPRQAQKGPAIEGRDQLRGLRTPSVAHARGPASASAEAIRSALAEIVTWGFTPVLPGSPEASVTKSPPTS